MVVKLVSLLIGLLLLVYGIYKACDMDYELDKYADEYNVLCTLGGIFWGIGEIISIAMCFCGCGGFGVRIGATMIVGGFTLFVEPFIHYLICKNK